MEYPTLITGGELGSTPGSGYLALVVAHEMAHQWWPMQTATNEAREPWLDEGLTEYSSVRFLAETGRKVAYHGRPDDVLTFEKSLYVGIRKPATLPAWEYNSNNLGAAVYGKTALGLWMLEGVVGTERLRAAMADYLALYRFKHPTGADFRDVLERALGEQSWFFDDYLNGDGVVDYKAEAIETTAGGSIVRVSRQGTVPAPVDIRITLADGTQQLKTWYGQANTVTFGFSPTQAVTKVEVDPEHKLKPEVYLINNSISADGQR
jgi:aminopeptidase N